MKIIRINRYLFSSRPFYDFNDNFSEDPHKDIFTRYLNQPKVKPTFMDNNNFEKNKSFQLSRQQYYNIEKMNKQGCIFRFEYKNTQFNIVSTNLNFVPTCNSIYKLLIKESPQLIFLQLRPDFLLDNFNLIKKKDGVFSNSLYFNQLKRSGFELMPSNQWRQKVQRELKKNKIYLKPLEEPFKSEYEQKIKNQFTPYVSKETLNNQTISLVAHYAQRYQTPIVLGQLPQISQRQHIANTHTLMQLQQIFKTSCRQLAMYNSTPKIISNFFFPEVMLHYGDRYMATLLQYIIALKKYKKITLFVGLMQNESIIQYLTRRQISSLIEDLRPQPPKDSLFRDIENFEIIQKHCLLDVLQHGSGIFDTTLQQLKTTSEMINFYADPQAIDRKMKQKLQLFRIDMYKKYSSILQKQYQIGEERKQKEFLRKII